MEILRGRIILLMLCLYPLYGYMVVSFLHSDPDYLSGLVIYGLGAELLITKFRNNENLRLPGYLLLLGLFTLYIFISKIFISDVVIETGLITYLYRDGFLRATVTLLIIENTRFDRKALDTSLKVLFWILIAAAGVSIIQIDNPLFFRNGGWLNGYGSFEQYEQYLQNLGPFYIDDVRPVKEGYRYSIYSWISGISVGLDALAIFSILLGIRTLPKLKRYFLIISAGLVSILSSSRWIMLNFIVIFYQRILGKSNRIFYSLQLIFTLAIILATVALTANFLGVDLNQFFKNRLLDSSAGTRLYAFEVFNKVFYDQPIFGTGGVDTPKMLMLIQGKTSQIHVGWLKLFYYYGLVGGVIYIVFIISLLRYLYQLAITSNYWGSFFALLAFVLANFTLVELSVFYHGILLAMIFSRYLSNQVESSTSSAKSMQYDNRFHHETIVLNK